MTGERKKFDACAECWDKHVDDNIINEIKEPVACAKKVETDSKPKTKA